jgi:hypothetical protein
MLRKIIFLALVASTAAYADKPATSDILKKAASTTSVETEEKAGTILDLNTSESQKVLTTLKSNEEVLKKVAEDRVDTLDEKSDVVTNYEAGTPVSQGNLYYYYYPVAAYPVNAQATDKVSATSGTSDLLSSPLLFILVPLLLLLVAVPVIALLSNTSTGRAFSGRNSDLDEKFGSFAELQTAIDYQLAKYMTALDSEDCMDRIVCELGVKASNIPHKNMFYSVVEWLAPEHGLLGYGRMTILKQAASGKYTMESCKKYMCNPPASIQAQ